MQVGKHRDHPSHDRSCAAHGAASVLAVQRSTAINLHRCSRTAASPSRVDPGDAHLPVAASSDWARAQRVCGAARAAFVAGGLSKARVAQLTQAAANYEAIGAAAVGARRFRSHQSRMLPLRNRSMNRASATVAWRIAHRARVQRTPAMSVNARVVRDHLAISNASDRCFALACRKRECGHRLDWLCPSGRTVGQPTTFTYTCRVLARDLRRRRPETQNIRACRAASGALAGLS
jgi:hypothetical protein